jgi:ABC-type xylose transport system permease subunit
MGCCFIPVLVALLLGTDAAIVQLFRKRRAGRGWWAALIAAWTVGAAAGLWSGFFFEFQPSPRMRVLGFPVPAGCFLWEGPPGEETWVDYVTPAPLLFAASNIAIVGVVASWPVGLVFWLRNWGTRRRQQRTVVLTPRSNEEV